MVDDWFDSNINEIAYLYVVRKSQIKGITYPLFFWWKAPFLAPHIIKRLREIELWRKNERKTWKNPFVNIDNYWGDGCRICVFFTQKYHVEKHFVSTQPQVPYYHNLSYYSLTFVDRYNEHNFYAKDSNSASF